MSTGRLIPLCTVVLLAMPLAARAEITVRIAPESTSLFIHEPFTLRLEVECDSPPDTPRVPAVPDLALVTVHRLPSEPGRRRHVFEIGLIAERDGSLTVPPFAVHAGGETAMTAALRLRISTPRPATEMTLAIAVEPTTLRIGQTATVTVTWTSAVPFSNCKQLLLEIPLLADARCHLFPLEPSVPDSERIGLPANNIRVVAQSAVLPDRRQGLTFRYALIPREPCVLRTPPARLVCALLEGKRAADQTPSYFYNQFFSGPDDNEAFERVYLAASVPELTVRAVTEPGRNSRFAEIVGPCELRASVTPAQLVVGQPALLTVQLDNLVFARHVTALPAASFAGLLPEWQVSPEPIRETATDHACAFTHIVRPLRSGITRVPAIVIQTFNPDASEYRTLRTAALPVVVEPDQEDATHTVTPRVDSKPPVELNGIRQNLINEQAMISVLDILDILGSHWWAIVPLPPLLWLALLPVVRRWDRCRRDPIFARSIAALWRFRRTARRDEEIAWRNYLADRLSLCAEALTADSVTEALRARNVGANLVAETRRRFEERDAVDYGKRPVAPSQSTRNLVRRLQKATAPLLLLCGLFVPLQAKAAESPDELFSRALRLRGEKPDEAQPLFVEAALGFESAKRFQNAGNGWFFAGENGRALANYRAAERRSPFDGQLRESIEFLRANRADAFPPATTTTGRVAAIWAQFCTWAAVLRMGLFVALYLAASLIFLAAQLLGRRFRRAVWAVLIVAVSVPLLSVAQTSLQPCEGVIVEDAVARLGPGYAYDPAFKQSLHKATEFSWREAREGWIRIGLPDGSEGWLRESDCMKVE